MIERLRRYYQKRHEAKAAAGWFFRELRHRPGGTALLTLFAVIAGPLAAALAWFNKEIIDRATAGTGASFAVGLFCILGGLTLLNILFAIARRLTDTFLNELCACSVREKLFSRILSGRWQALSAYHSGDVMTRLTGDVDIVTRGLLTQIPQLGFLLAELVCAFLMLYHYDAMLATLAAVIAPLGTLCALPLTSKLMTLQKQFRENESAMRSRLQEGIEHLAVVKCFRAEAHLLEEYTALWRRRRTILRKKFVWDALVSLSVRLFFSGGYLAAFGWGAWRLSQGEITYGTMALFLSLVTMIQSPFHSLRFLMQDFIGVLVSSGRLMQFDAVERETVGETAPPENQAVLQLDHVTFRYAPDGPAVLHDVTLAIAPGETVGIVGCSGAGKTTLLRLILALVTPSEGAIAFHPVSGHRIEPISAATRRRVGYVPQGNTLFSGTIRENLLLAAPLADETALWQVLDTAEAADFVRGLPQGLDTVLTEKGGRISEGQAQRLAIARALLTSADLLILDEATAALDEETENRFLEKLRRRGTHQAILLITHRPHLLGLCTRTYRLADGKLHEIQPD